MAQKPVISVQVEENKEETTNESLDDLTNDIQNRPISARSKSKFLHDLSQYALLMSGLKTEKEKKLAAALGTLIKKLNEKDASIKVLESKNKEVLKKLDKYEDTTKKTREILYKEQQMRTSAISDQQRIKAAMAKIQKAVSARLKLLGIDFDNITSIGEALDASLKAINSLVAQLQSKEELVAKLEKDIEKYKTMIADQKQKIANLEETVSKQKDIIKDQKIKLKDQSEKIKDLESKNKSLEEENEELRKKLKQITEEYAKFKKETQEKFDEMAKKILDQKTENVQKQSKIDELLKRIKELEDENEELRKKLKNITKEYEEYKKNAEEEIANMKSKLAEQTEDIKSKDAQIAELLAIVNKPKQSREVQTDISGSIDKQLSDYPRLLKEIVALKQLLEKKNQRINDLIEENKLLMLDMQWLLKRAAAFVADRSPHTGQVWQMYASPNSYIVATASTDMTCRLWKINPSADKEKKEKISSVIRKAHLDGKVDSLAWSKDGKYLAGGTGWRDGADGYVVVWSMDENNANKEERYNVLHAIRSRPTTRFGRCMALEFSPNGDYIYCGDTVGSIWCFHLESEKIVGLFTNHSDIVYDLSISPNGLSLFSVSLDQTLAVIVVPAKCGGIDLPKKSNDESKEDLVNNNNNNNNSSSNLISQTPRASKKKSSKKNKGNKTNRTSRNRSQTSAVAAVTPTSSSHKTSMASMTLKDLLEQSVDDEYKKYDGVELVKDKSYNFWKVAMSSNGNFVVCATRKIQIYKVTGNDTVEPGPIVSDLDNDHIKSLHVKNGYILVSRMGCPRAKMFHLETGKEFKKIACKKAIAQVDFLYDNQYCAVLQQELIPNAAPLPPKMTLFAYNQ